MIKWAIFVWTIVFCAWGYFFAYRCEKAEREERRKRKERIERIRRNAEKYVKEERERSRWEQK